MNYGQGDPFGSGGSTPDWAALAEESERKGAARRRRLVIGGAAVATLLVGGIVAVAVTTGSGGSPSDGPSQALPSPETLPPEPEPSFEDKLPPAPPQDYLKDPEKDTAPLSTDTLFPEAKALVNGRDYTRAAKDATTDCASVASDALGKLLEQHDCRKLFRATLHNGGLAVTVGIAVLPTEQDAAAVKSDYEPNVDALSGGAVPEYCTDVECRTTVNSLGRYAIMTLAGHVDGEPAGDDDEPAKQAAIDGSNYGYERLVDRGRRQAEADAEAG
ncbi:hypothetical protein [Streptomyces sp. TR06-5]|uniref:hypothetical protein n=1 Tax=unclassified Streptomyces TaxID=2593676 RepID=UPI0039A29BDE